MSVFKETLKAAVYMVAGAIVYKNKDRIETTVKAVKENVETKLKKSKTNSEKAEEVEKTPTAE